MSTPQERVRVNARRDQMAEMVLDQWMADPSLREKMENMADHFEANGETGPALVLHFAMMQLYLMMVDKEADTEGKS